MFLYESKIQEATGWEPGGDPFSIEMPSPLSINKSRVFLEVEHPVYPTDLLTLWSYVDVEGITRIDASDLAFMDANKIGINQIIKRQDADWSIDVYDSRGYEFESVWYPQNWSLQVAAQGLYTHTESAKTLASSRTVFVEGANSTPLNPGTQVTVEPTTGMTLAERTTRTLSWGEDEGFLFSFNAGDEGTIVVDEDNPETYQTTLRWTMVL